MESVILLADDEPIVRKGLIALLNHNFKVKEINEASNCNELMNLLKNKPYTHLITEILLADGSTSSVLPSIREIYPDLKIMVFSDLTEEVIKSPLVAFGIYYFISKKALEHLTIRSIEKFLNNEIPINALKRIENSSKLLSLSPREFEVYSLLLLDKSTTEIAQELNIKKCTVSVMKHKIFEKNNVKNWKELKELSSLHTIQGRKTAPK